MLKLYYSGAPNPTKVALFLEEAGLEYDAIPVDTRRGDQFKAEFLALNPNAKVPVIVDDGNVIFAGRGIAAMFERLRLQLLARLDSADDASNRYPQTEKKPYPPPCEDAEEAKQRVTDQFPRPPEIVYASPSR